MKRRRNLQANGCLAAQEDGRRKKSANKGLAKEGLSRTDEKLEQAKAELEKLNETLTTLFQSAPDAIVTVDAAGRIMHANAQAASFETETGPVACWLGFVRS